MRISDWSSDVCSSDLSADTKACQIPIALGSALYKAGAIGLVFTRPHVDVFTSRWADYISGECRGRLRSARSEEHTSELQSLMRISYAVFCLKKKNKTNT